MQFSCAIVIAASALFLNGCLSGKDANVTTSLATSATTTTATTTTTTTTTTCANIAGLWEWQEEQSDVIQIVQSGCVWTAVANAGFSWDVATGTVNNTEITQYLFASPSAPADGPYQGILNNSVMTWSNGDHWAKLNSSKVDNTEGSCANIAGKWQCQQAQSEVIQVVQSDCAWAAVSNASFSWDVSTGSIKDSNITQYLFASPSLSANGPYKGIVNNTVIAWNDGGVDSTWVKLAEAEDQRVI